jgi:hypothetical protein
MLTGKKTFKQRAAEISDQALNSRSALGEGADFARGLDETERQREFLFFPSFACKEKERKKKTGNLIIVTNMQSSEPLTTALQL